METIVKEAPQILISEAEPLYMNWARFHQLPDERELVAQQWQRWSPLKLMLDQMKDPVVVSVNVRGYRTQFTSPSWSSVFASLEEFATIYSDQMLPFNETGAATPAFYMMTPQEARKFAAETLSHCRCEAAPVKLGHDRQPFHHWEVKALSKCIDKDQRLFMGIVRADFVFICNGAIILRFLQCTPLPESEYIQMASS